MLSLRHNDFVARMDGDYFAILLDGLKEISHAKIVADRMLGETAESFRVRRTRGPAVGEHRHCASARPVTRMPMTCCTMRRPRCTVHSVLGGSHCEVFDTAILKSEQAELQLEGDFDGALQRREFELFYQPIVSLESNEVLGFEALVRWRHPVLGMIAPLDFIPIAERTGFIVPLGTWILHEACLRLTEWHRSLPLRERPLGVGQHLERPVERSHARRSD